MGGEQRSTWIRALGSCLVVALAAISSAVIGFCAGGLFGPRLFGHGGQGLEEIGFMFNGALIGAAAGTLAALASFRFERAARRRFVAGLAFAALLVALGTWIAVARFDAW